MNKEKNWGKKKKNCKINIFLKTENKERKKE